MKFAFRKLKDALKFGHVTKKCEICRRIHCRCEKVIIISHDLFTKKANFGRVSSKLRSPP